MILFMAGKKDMMIHSSLFEAQRWRTLNSTEQFYTCIIEAHGVNYPL